MAGADSFLRMIRDQALRAREKLVSELSLSGELLRGSLLERTVRHTKDCPKCARGEGHQVFVLTVTYPADARVRSACAASGLWRYVAGSAIIRI